MATKRELEFAKLAKALLEKLVEYKKEAKRKSGEDTFTESEVQNHMGILSLDKEEDIIDTVSEIVPDLGSVVAEKLAQLKDSSEDGTIRLTDVVDMLLEIIKLMPNYLNGGSKSASYADIDSYTKQASAAYADEDFSAAYAKIERELERLIRQ